MHNYTYLRDDENIVVSIIYTKSELKDVLKDCSVEPTNENVEAFMDNIDRMENKLDILSAELDEHVYEVVIKLKKEGAFS